MSTSPKRRRKSRKRNDPGSAPRRRRRRRNEPGRATRAVRRVGGILGGMNFRQALASMPGHQIGMFAAKWAAKRFGDKSPASETDPASWTWDSYAKGVLGGVAAGAIGQAIKPGLGQKILEGALNLMAFKAIENELIAESKSDFLKQQLGAEQPGGYEPGDIVMTDQGTPAMLGEDGQWRDASAAMLPDAGIGEELAPPSALGEIDPWERAMLGAELETPGALGAAEEGGRRDPYAFAYFGR